LVEWSYYINEKVNKFSEAKNLVFDSFFTMILPSMTRKTGTMGIEITKEEYLLLARKDLNSP
jgi:hypothetical protein